LSVTAPYQTLASYYTHVMSHVDYPGWIRHLRTLWRKYQGSKPPGRILEIAAGTCPFASSPLFPGAFTVYTDQSPSMLRIASPSGAQTVPLRVACDARSLPLREPFDLAVMIYDSFNYLLHPEDILRSLREIKQILRPQGLFIFDVTTETCSRRHFADTLDFEELHAPTAGNIIRVSRYDARSRMQLNLFTFFMEGKDGRYDRREEVHRQRIYTVAALKKQAERAGFQVLACLAEFTLKPGSDRNERVHFVLQKP
jgi:SAM-dependent methyltransferase